MVASLSVGATLQQRRHAGGIALAGCHMERRHVLGARGGVGVAAASQEGFHAGRLVVMRGKHEWQVIGTATRATVGPISQQEAHSLGVAVAGRCSQRSRVILDPGLCVSPRLQKLPHNGGMTGTRRSQQRRACIRAAEREAQCLHRPAAA